MDFTSLAGIKFAWDFVQPFLTDRFKKELDSSTKARRLAFDLYEKLGFVRRSTINYVSCLKSFYFTMKDSPTLAQQQEIKRELIQAMTTLSEELSDLEDVVRILNPNLEIHVPRVAGSISNHLLDRSKLIGAVGIYINPWNLDTFAQYDLTKLWGFVEEAETNQGKIRNAIDEYRTFLAIEFPFKEGF